MKIISVANQKGGVGKTTTSLNIASELANSGKKVLLIDLDPQGNLTSGLNLKPIPEDNSFSSADSLTSKQADLTIYDVLLNDKSIKEVGVDSGYENLTVVPANIELAGAEVELVSEMSRENLLKGALRKVKKDFDIAVIDCPPSLGLLTINGLVAADHLIIPVQAEYYALEGLGQLLNTYKLVRKKLNPSINLLGVVITMYDARTNLSREVASELSQEFPEKIFNTIIPRNISLGEAPSFGQPIHKYAPLSAGAISYKNLVKEIISRLEKK